MRQYFTFLVFLLSFIGVQQIGAQDKIADPLLDQMSSTIKNANGIKANVTLIIKMPSGKIKENKSGQLWSKGNAFKILMGENQIYCDGSTIWNYNAKNKEVQINDYNPKETTVSPEKLFSSSFKKDFNYHYVGVRVINGVKYRVIRMNPKDSKSDYTSVELLIDPSTHVVSRGYVTDKNKNTYIYQLSNIKLSENIASSEFTFNITKYPQVEIIDLR